MHLPVPPPFFLVCVKYSHFKLCTNLHDVCKSDSINVNDDCFFLFVLPFVYRIQDTVVQDCKFLTKKFFKKMKEKKESSISRQTEAQRKTNVRKSFETEFFFYLALHIKINTSPSCNLHKYILLRKCAQVSI